MKKIVIILAVIVLVLGGLGIFLLSGNSTDNGDTEEETTIAVGNKTYYEAEYADGNSSEKIGSLSYSMPAGFTPVNSDDDSVIENNFINTDTGVQLSITQIKGKSEAAYKELSDEYLDGAEDIEKFDVNGNTAYKYVYKDGDKVIECDFHVAAGGSFYSGILFHPEDVEDEQADEPEAIAITDEELAQFDALCKSLSIN